MKSRRGYLIGGLIVAIALGVLLVKAFENFGSYSMTVSQFLDSQSALGMSVSQYNQTQTSLGAKEVKVHGWVSDKGARPAGGFVISDGKQDLTVMYSGGLASTLAGGTEVVVRGKASAGGLKADGVTTTKEVRLEGPLAGDVQVNYDVKTRTTTFAITDGKDFTGAKQKISVIYTGPVPDTFFVDVKSADVSMVVVGKEGPNGVFEASQILTKCASKYQAAPSTTSPSAAISPSSK